VLCNTKNEQICRDSVGFPHVRCSLPFHFSLDTRTPKIFHFSGFKGNLHHPQVPITISSGLHKMLLAQTPSLYSLGEEADNTGSCTATLILGTNSKGTQLKDLARGLRFACRVLCVFSRDQSDCEKLWFSIHFLHMGKRMALCNGCLKILQKNLNQSMAVLYTN